MFKYLLLACLLAFSYATIGEICNTEEECNEGECCQKLSQYMVASKRVATVSLLEPERLGSCQRYKLQNETCGLWDKLNGYCSCGPGLICYAFQVPIKSVRTMIAPQPGYQWAFQCKTSQP